MDVGKHERADGPLSYPGLEMVESDELAPDTDLASDCRGSLTLLAIWSSISSFRASDRLLFETVFMV